MPDDANGNYTLPSGYLAVTGQTIQPSQHNPPLEDIATALTGRLPRSGVAPMTGPLKTVTGSASVPAISPNSNPSIGIYFTSTGVAFSGTVTGVRFIGELIPYTLLVALPQTVFPYGQTLLRASYPDLWAKAQADIALGNTFYNNGNGSTTFGIGDMRGRVAAGRDDMGGSAAGRLTTAGSGVNGTVLGASGGGETTTLTASQLPVITPTFTGVTGIVSVTSVSSSLVYGSGFSRHQAGGSAAFGVLDPGLGAVTSSGNFTPSGTVSSFGAGAAHNNMPPTMVCNYLLYVGD